MTGVDLIAYSVVTLTTVVVLAACGSSVGYLVARASWLQDRQDNWRRARDVYDAALTGSLSVDALANYEEDPENALPPFGALWHADPANNPPPLGVHPFDSKVMRAIPIDPSKRDRQRWRIHWFRYALLACNICTGWHAIWMIEAAWAVVSWVTGEPSPVGWANAVPVWLAAGFLHTWYTARGNKKAIW